MALASPNTDDAGFTDLISIYTGTGRNVLSHDASLGDVGLDSITAVQLANDLLIKFNLVIHSDELFGISLGNLQKHITSLRPTTVQTDMPDLSRNKGPIQNRTISSSSRSNPQKRAESVQNPFVALVKSSREFESAAKKSGFHAYWDKVAPLQDDIVLAYISEAFHSLGVDLSAYPHGTEIPLIQHIPSYDRLMERLWRLLESRYIVIHRSGKVLRGSDSIDVDQASQLCQNLRTQYPRFACEANLMALVGPKLADCLRGRTDPVSVLFGSKASLQIMEEFYAHAPMMSASTDQLVAFILAILRNGDYSREHPARILEVGAGTGGTTARLAEALASAGIAVEYVFTDVGKAFVSNSMARFAKRYPWMRFEVLDLEHDVPSTFRGRYDITLGTNVVHATSDRVLTCRRLRGTLLAGGIMVLSEVTREINWYDICFGLLDGWWLSEAGKGYPIQQADTWMDTFNRAGFSSMNFSTGPTEEERSQQLLVACNRKWDVTPSVVS
ncbi:MAG: hypothetical protein L6R41_002703 [Letrouitia leprolyta]|nr:MAG: hypothetical protein L6R41_002703 [Letrouitia leprolyta]